MVDVGICHDNWHKVTMTMMRIWIPKSVYIVCLSIPSQKLTRRGLGLV